MDAIYTHPTAITANEYMLQAVRKINEAFGNGYAKDHPELVGAYMQTVAIGEQSRHIEQLGVLIQEVMG